MAYRTSQEAVEGILGDNYDKAADTDLTPFIRTANVLIDEVVTCATGRGITLATALLVELECWVAAHLYGHSDQFYSEKETGDAQAKFQGETKMNLQSTQYGQTAITLDVSGCLASISSGARASVAWLGRPPSAQTPYVDRD